MSLHLSCFGTRRRDCSLFATDNLEISIFLIYFCTFFLFPNVYSIRNFLIHADHVKKCLCTHCEQILCTSHALHSYYVPEKNKNLI